MQNPFNINGLTFWSEQEIKLREMFRDFFADRLRADLMALNDQWKFHYIEAPLLTPRELLNANYTGKDVWDQAGHGDSERPLTLRPETTPGSYAYAQYLLNEVHPPVKPPFCVWQAGKSFRREIIQPVKHMRLKEFYQQEFQCVYTEDTATDYHEEMLEPVRKMIAAMLHLPTRLVESDRLPAYSLRTMDVEVWNGDKWMEVCSISKRTDFPQKLEFMGKKVLHVKDALVLEVAIGLDRCVYNWMQAQKPDLNRTPPDNWMEEAEAAQESEAHPT